MTNKWLSRKGTCHRAGSSTHPHGGGNKLTPASCPLTATPKLVMAEVCPVLHKICLLKIQPCKVSLVALGS